MLGRVAANMYMENQINLRFLPYVGNEDLFDDDGLEIHLNKFDWKLTRRVIDYFEFPIFFIKAVDAEYELSNFISGDIVGFWTYRLETLKEPENHYWEMAFGEKAVAAYIRFSNKEDSMHFRLII